MCMESAATARLLLYPHLTQHLHLHLLTFVLRLCAQAAEEEDGVGVAAASLDMLRLSVKDADQVRVCWGKAARTVP